MPSHAVRYRRADHWVDVAVDAAARHTVSIRHTVHHTTLAGARIRVEVDGELAGFVKLPKGGEMAEFGLATALPVGSHTVTFLKVTEDNAQKNTKVCVAV